MQARGIDKVIVVSSASGFSSQAAIPGINAAAQVRDDKGLTFNWRQQMVEILLLTQTYMQLLEMLA